LVISFLVWQRFLKKEEPDFTLAEVIRGNISQEISETGQLQRGEEINLSFKASGRIKKIYVEVGEEVEAEDVLVEIDATDINIQLQEAKASLSLAQAELDKLLTGASPEEIKVSQTVLDNKQIALDEANQGLEEANEDALNSLEDSYLEAYNSENMADSIQETYFTGDDWNETRVKEKEGEIEKAVSQISDSLDSAKLESTQENIDLTLSQVLVQLSVISDALKVIRQICEKPDYSNVVSSTDKISLDTQRKNINTALANLTDSQQEIDSAKLAIESAEGELQKAQDELTLLTSPPRQEDVDLYEAKVTKAQSQVDRLENQLQETFLKAPIKGQITNIKKRVGETVAAASQDIVMVLLPDVPFTIELDVYEEDIVKINIGNPVDISLVAFPNQIFKGKLISIEPAEELIEGVVYYKISIIPERLPEGVKPGMTADVTIKTSLKENVLIIPEDALQEKDGRQIVEVFKNRNSELREIQLGVAGSDDMVEVLSGLEEGEKVILR